MNCMSMDSISEVFYHRSKMLIATKHIADMFFSKTAYWHIFYATYPNLSTSLFLTHDPKSPDVIGEPH